MVAGCLKTEYASRREGGTREEERGDGPEGAGFQPEVKGAEYASRREGGTREEERGDGPEGAGCPPPLRGRSGTKFRPRRGGGRPDPEDRAPNDERETTDRRRSARRPPKRRAEARPRGPSPERRTRDDRPEAKRTEVLKQAADEASFPPEVTQRRPNPPPPPLGTLNFLKILPACLPACLPEIPRFLPIFARVKLCCYGQVHCILSARSPPPSVARSPAASRGACCSNVVAHGRRCYGTKAN